HFLELFYERGSCVEFKVNSLAKLHDMLKPIHLRFEIVKQRARSASMKAHRRAVVSVQPHRLHQSAHDQGREDIRVPALPLVELGEGGGQLTSEGRQLAVKDRQAVGDGDKAISENVSGAVNKRSGRNSRNSIGIRNTKDNTLHYADFSINRHRIVDV